MRADKQRCVRQQNTLHRLFSALGTYLPITFLYITLSRYLLLPLTGTELRISTSCPSCAHVKATTSAHRPCARATARGTGVCGAVAGETVAVPWLCGARECDSLAREKWRETCRRREEEHEREREREHEKKTG